jgi:hypothetical protein
MTRALAFTVILAGCMTADDSVDDNDDVELEAATTGMSIVNHQLRKDNVAFEIRGFNMIGALTPAWCKQGSGTAARDHFGATELDREITAWHANTIRLQVSQRGLGDTTRTPAERDAYLAEIQADVTLARSKGLVVILSMQDQSIGCGNVHPLPSSQTITAWQKLAPAFASQLYVMYELFNEPQNGHTAADWPQWKNGGAGPIANLGDTAVGHEQLVTTIRGTGATNVVLADGGDHAEHLDNITPYLLTESSGRGIGYVIHPYYYTPGLAYWQKSWGFLTASRVVIADEWNFKADDCGTKDETLAPQLLQWLHDNHIGLTGHAFDALGTLVADWSWTPTACGTASPGAGAVLKSWFATLAAQ